MTQAEYEQKLDEVDRLLNDPSAPTDPAKVWSLLAEIAQHSNLLRDNLERIRDDRRQPGWQRNVASQDDTCSQTARPRPLTEPAKPERVRIDDRRVAGYQIGGQTPCARANAEAMPGEARR